MCGAKGEVVFYSIKEQEEVQAIHPDNAPVEDAQWNPKEDYLLVSYKDSMKLFEAGKDKPSFEFDPQGVGISSTSISLNRR